MAVLAILPALLALVVVGGGFIMVLNALTRPRKFFPGTTIEAFIIIVKLLCSPWYKVWNYKKYIKPGMEIADDLWFKLPYKVDTQRAQRYSDVCQLQVTKTQEVPLLYPATTFMYPSVCLLLRRRYLFPLIGAIHTHNYFRFMKPLDQEETYEALLLVDHYPKVVKPGVEIRYPAYLLDKQTRKEVWNSTTTLLIKAKHKYGERLPSLPPSFMDAALEAKHKVDLVKQGEWSFPSNQGITYAKVAGDWNPIHVSALVAKMSGFPRAIAHGMFLCARVFDEALGHGLKEGVLNYPLESEVRFRKPVLLPSKAVFMIYKVTGGGSSYYLYVIENPNKRDKDHPDRQELCLEGYVRNYQPTS